MTYYPNSGPRTIRADLSEAQRDDLARLEARAAPTDLQRGQLAAIRICASGPDRQRADELYARWLAKPSTGQAS